MEEKTKEGGTCEGCGMEYIYINFKNPNRECLRCGLVGFGGNPTQRALDGANKSLKKLLEQIASEWTLEDRHKLKPRRAVKVGIRKDWERLGVLLDELCHAIVYKEITGEFPPSSNPAETPRR